MCCLTVKVVGILWFWPETFVSPDLLMKCSLLVPLIDSEVPWKLLDFGGKMNSDARFISCFLSRICLVAKLIPSFNCFLIFPCRDLSVLDSEFWLKSRTRLVPSSTDNSHCPRSCSLSAMSRHNKSNNFNNNAHNHSLRVLINIINNC